MTRREWLAAAGAALAPAARSAMGFSPDCFIVARGPRTAFEYLEYAWERGAGGVQAVLPSFEPEYLKKVRERAGKLGMYLEITTALPEQDPAQFEQTVKAAKDVGALCLRSVCLGGRRYENFSSMADWNEFVKTSKARLAAAVRIVERYRIPLGIENHKDWTVDEMVPLLKSYDSEFLGACIDWGNNLSLLDDPGEVVSQLAPFAINSHIKDMAVDEYPDGFLLAEVPLGQGILPLREMLETIRKARPGTRFSLDMLTRNPLRIPCLTEKYWATFPARSGMYMARTLKMVRANRKTLVTLDNLDASARAKLEQENIRQSVEYARDQLGLRA